MTSVAREQDDSCEFSDASQNEHNNLANDSAQAESDYDSRGSDSDLSDRENNDSQETERRVDDDEDRSNPQYIPKKGTFYEHDDRTAASAEDNVTSSADASERLDGAAPSPAAVTERRRPPRKSDICDKWSHDKYKENEQVLH